MAFCITSTFSEPEDFATALQPEGFCGLLVTESGSFRADLKQVSLHQQHLSVAEERLSRIAFITVPAGMVLISFTLDNETEPVWGGIRMRRDEIKTLGSGESAYVRTEGPSRWGALRMPSDVLARYGMALHGAPLQLSDALRLWRPRPAANRRFRRLHAIAIRMAQVRPHALVNAQAAHGIEQHLVHAVVECLSSGSMAAARPSVHRHLDTMNRFELLIQSQPKGMLSVPEISATLGVSERLLRGLCAEHLGMSPHRYDRLLRMSRVRSTLRSAGPDVTDVSDVARRQGFQDLGRFATEYFAAFGELPSTTLRLGAERGIVAGRPEK